jgi:hypothetical protein
MPTPHQTATLELIDKALGYALDPKLQENNDVCEYTIDIVFGGRDDQGILVDLLTLARIALVHLRGASYLVHEDQHHEPMSALREDSPEGHPHQG